jgi:hypothetical protein
MSEFKLVPKDIRQKNEAQRANGNTIEIIARNQAQRAITASEISRLSNPQTPSERPLEVSGVVGPNNSALLKL